MSTQRPSPTLATTRTCPGLVLCADGGGSKVCVVIRSADGIEVRGIAGPCNVQSVGHGPAIQTILLATYRALAQLPSTHLPENVIMPNLTTDPLVSSPLKPSIAEGSTNHRIHAPTPISLAALSARSIPVTPSPSRPTTPRLGPLPYLSQPLFQYVWLGMAGINSLKDEVAFMPVVMRGLNIVEERVKITNDVNLLAAPALQLPGIKHVAAVVCGTGTVGRTIEVAHSTPTEKTDTGASVRQLPLTDVGVSRGWGWLLCDEGSAFWIGRLAIRALLFHVDRGTRSSIYATPPEPLLPLHKDLLNYFGVTDPMELIGICSLIGPSADQNLSIGEATAKRNAYMAGVARTVLRWAFPDDASPPTPPASERSEDMDSSAILVEDDISKSRKEALKLVKKAIRPMVEMTIDLLGDGSVVKPATTVLALGGGLWQSRGYRGMLQEGLKKEGVEFAEVMLVDDAAGVGAKGLASVEFESV